jgi:hypothetical protein
MFREQHLCPDPFNKSAEFPQQHFHVFYLIKMRCGPESQLRGIISFRIRAQRPIAPIVPAQTYVCVIGAEARVHKDQVTKGDCNCAATDRHKNEAAMASLKSILYALLALSCARGVAACNDQHDPLEATRRSLRETKTNGTTGIDHGLSGDSKGEGGIVEGEGFFIINDKNWASEEQFVLGGGRCQTQKPSAAQRARHAADLKNFRDDDGLHRRLQVVTNTIYVNWVVISNTAGAGSLLQWQMDSQVNILNAAFAPHFRFQVYNVQRVVSNKLFTCTNYTEYEMSNDYGARNRAVLNMFTCYPPGFLGWSRYPSGGIAGSVWDLAVVAHNTLPGGNLGPYSYGHVSMVTENHGILNNQRCALTVFFLHRRLMTDCHA